MEPQSNFQIEDEEDEEFSYDNLFKAESVPIPPIAKDAKYKKVLPLNELNFLEYITITEKDELNYVYRPGDDSFFMLNVLKQQINDWPIKWRTKSQALDNGINLKQQSDLIIAQLGSGSGILSAHVSSWLKQKKQQPLLHVSIDINMDASLLSQKYYDKYNLPVLQINTSLFKNTIFSQKEGIIGSIKPQIIIFNPPYIPVTQEQIENEQKYLVEKIKKTVQMKKCERKRQQNMIAFSYMGGIDGLNITRKLLKSIFWDCWIYLIIMEQQGYLQIIKEIQNYKQFWSQYYPQYQLKGKVQLMQFMNFKNQDLFLIRVQVQTQ